MTAHELHTELLRIWLADPEPPDQLTHELNEARRASRALALAECRASIPPCWQLVEVTVE